MSAEVEVTVRTTSASNPNARLQPIPLEPFSVNKEMGRILLRKGGETIAAGKVSDSDETDVCKLTLTY